MGLLLQAVGLIVPVLWALAIVASDDLQNTVEFTTLERICIHEEFDINEIKHIRFLNEEAKQARAGVCSQFVLDAIGELYEVVTTNGEDVCTKEKAEQIRDFYYNWVAAKDKQGRSNSMKKLPKPILKFFLSLGFRTSKLCKEATYKTLSPNVLSQEDLDAMDFITKNLRDMLNKPSDYDDLILAQDLNQVYYNKRSNTKQPEVLEQMRNLKTFIKGPANVDIGQIKQLCHRRFKPLYDRSVIPILILSRIGLYYANDLSKKRFVAITKTEKNDRVSQFYRIIFLCEALENIVQISNDGNDTSSGDKQDKTTDNADNVDNQGEVNQADADTKPSQEASGAVETKDGDVHVAPVVQVVKVEEVGEEIQKDETPANSESDPGPDQLDGRKLVPPVKYPKVMFEIEDEKFAELAKGFRKSKSETGRLRDRLSRKFVNHLYVALKSGKFRVIGSAFGIGNKKTDTDDQLTKAIEEYISGSKVETKESGTRLSDWFKTGSFFNIKDVLWSNKKFVAIGVALSVVYIIMISLTL